MKPSPVVSSVNFFGKHRILAVGVASLLAPLAGAHGQAISIGGISTYTQDFNTLPAAPGTNWVDNSTLAGWYARTDSLTPPALPLGIYNGGSGVVSGLLSIGAFGNTDRAFGARPTTTNYGMVVFGALFRNTSASALSVGDIEYNGELWFTQATANNRDGFQFFYQVATAPITDLLPFTVNNGATYANNAAVADPGWIRVAALDYSDVNAAANTALGAPVIGNVKFSLGITLQPDAYLMLRWRNPNDTAGDAVMGIDDLSVRFTAAPKEYNLSHTVGGAPDGMLVVSPAAYWLSGTVPVGLETGDSIMFSQDMTAGSDEAIITAPAPMTLGSIAVINDVGTYTLKTDANVTASRLIGNGPQPLRKTGAGTLILQGAGSGDGGLIFDEGTIQLISTTGGGLSGVVYSSPSVINTGGIIVTGTGTSAALLGGGASDFASNSYVGTTTVASGNLVANKSAGVIAIPGDLVIHSGATFRYAGNNAGDQIADGARVTIDGGSFGDITPAGTNPTNPGAAETVADVTLTANGGDFSSGRAAFTITGALTVFGGRALAHRAGTINAEEVIVAGGSIDLDGGSATGGSQSRLNVGSLGLTLMNGTINLNSHASGVGATSVGSIVTLFGDVTSTGTSLIADIRTADMTAAEATVDLGGIDRGFDVTGTLTIGSDTAPIRLTNGGVVKDGAGDLILAGSQTLSSLTINDGAVQLGAAAALPSPDPEIGFGDDTPLLEDGSAAEGAVQAVPEPGALSLLTVGLIGWLSRRRRPGVAGFKHRA